MKVPAKYQNRVYSIQVSEGNHSEDPKRDAYELILAEGWVYDDQHEFICDTQKEVLSIIRGATQE